MDVMDGERRSERAIPEPMAPRPIMDTFIVLEEVMFYQRSSLSSAGG